MPNLEVYRIGYTIKGQSPTETELDATNLCELITLFHQFLNENPGDVLESIDYIQCFRLPDVFPDGITQEQMHDYGYTWNGMVPMGVIGATERFKNNLPVYALHENDSESLMESFEEIWNHTIRFGLFGYEAPVVSIC